MKIVSASFFFYPVIDLPRARRFYEGVLGLTVGKVFGASESGEIKYVIRETALTISNLHASFAPSKNGGMIVFEVESFSTAIASLSAADVRFVVPPFESPLCQGAIVSDPDGNSLMIQKRKQL
ncbi:MAG TPA: VOC family protein [Opitutaceae bacterium]